MGEGRCLKKGGEVVFCAEIPQSRFDLMDCELGGRGLMASRAYLSGAQLDSCRPLGRFSLLNTA